MQTCTIQVKDLFQNHSYIKESHLKKETILKRTFHMFETCANSEILDEFTLRLALFYLKKILKNYTEKIDDIKFKSLFVVSLYFSLNFVEVGSFTLTELYQTFDLYVQYITLEEIRKHRDEAVSLLNFDLSFTASEFNSLCAYQER
jgi:hypothetical protein